MSQQFLIEDANSACEIEAIDGLVHVSLAVGSAHILAVLTPEDAALLAGHLVNAANEASAMPAVEPGADSP